MTVTQFLVDFLLDSIRILAVFGGLILIMIAVTSVMGDDR